MIQHKINFELLAWETPFNGIRHKIYKDDNKIVRLVEYSKEMPSHWCKTGHYGMILDGEFEVEFEDKKIQFKKGDGVFIPSGEEYKHRAKVLTDFVSAIFIENNE
jgi:quercetin dioxygenase-like cupin family protein